MTPQEEALRDAFLAECWAPVREYHDTPDVPVPQPVAMRARTPREQCPICGVRYASSRLADHVIDSHPEALDNSVENGLGAAS